jgi:hypothetical protein
MITNTFEDRWGIKKSYAYYLIESAGVIESLTDSVCTLVQNNQHARELAKVPAVIETGADF